MASFILLAMIMPVVFTPTAKLVTVNDVQAENSLKLAIESPSVLGSKSAVSQIVPGESLVEKQAREKVEAEAKAKAEAVAKSNASRQVVAREKRVYSDPSNFEEIYLRAQNAYGVDARILHAVHQVETGSSGSDHRAISSHGATGPMQFLPSTWRRHGVDGNGDGVADIHNVEDAIFSAASYLKACGYPDVHKALWGYNPSTRYFNHVISIARSYGYN
jgi:membrane-bound lytic murein transglycosylase B